MNFFSRPIHISLSPNLSFDDVKRALRMLVQPWQWGQTIYLNQVEEWFKTYTSCSNVFSFASGRIALFALLKSFALPRGSEVLVQAFTCVAVPNSVRWAGLVPVYVDIDKSLNMSLTDAEKKLTSRTRVLVIQHTFGIPADMEKIKNFCQTHNLFLLEDCAHALGATYKGKVLGSFGDAAFFSFGRDKVVSSVSGGIAVVNTGEYVQAISDYHKTLKPPSVLHILQELLHPLLTFIALYTYYFFDMGKAILWLSQKLHLLSFPVSPTEKQGKKLPQLERIYSNALAYILISQLLSLEVANRKRRLIAQTYFKNLSDAHLGLPEKTAEGVYLRFNVLTERADEFRFRAKQKGIILGNWYHKIIDPIGTQLATIGYVVGSCKLAEKAANESLNLPTYPLLSDKQVKEITDFLLTYK